MTSAPQSKTVHTSGRKGNTAHPRGSEGSGDPKSAHTVPLSHDGLLPPCHESVTLDPFEEDDLFDFRDDADYEDPDPKSHPAVNS